MSVLCINKCTTLVVANTQRRGKVAKVYDSTALYVNQMAWRGLLVSSTHTTFTCDSRDV